MSHREHPKLLNAFDHHRWAVILEKIGYEQADT
jgi:hypothetical protein